MEVEGKIIVNDISKNSLHLDNVKAPIVEINDKNGARIVTSELKGRENSIGLTSIGAIHINGEGDVLLEGDFYEASIFVNNPVNIKVGKDTSIQYVCVELQGEGTTFSSIGTDNDPGTRRRMLTITNDYNDVAAAIGEIDGKVDNDLKDRVLLNKENITDLINMIKDMPLESAGTNELYIQMGWDILDVLKILLGELGDDYDKYPNHAKHRLSYGLRFQMIDGKVNTLNALEASFKSAKEWTGIYLEGMKYAAHQGNFMMEEIMKMEVENYHYDWPVISKEINVGDDITDIFMTLKDLKSKPNLAITIEEEGYWNLFDYLDSDYLTVNSDKKVILKKINKGNRPIDISIWVWLTDKDSYDEDFGIYQIETGMNFIARLEPQEHTIETNLRSLNEDVIFHIENNIPHRFISTYENVTVKKLLENIATNPTVDLRVIDKDDNVITVLDTLIERLMRLELIDGEKWACYDIDVVPFLSSNNLNVVKDVYHAELIVQIGKNVSEVIEAINKTHDYYELKIIYDNEDKVNGEEIVKGNMKLIVDTGTGRYYYNILIDFGEVKLINLDNPDGTIIKQINNEFKIIETFDDNTVEGFLEKVQSQTDGDELMVVDSYNVPVIGTELINSFMRLRISREGVEVYYLIQAHIVLNIEGVDIINKITDDYKIIIYPDKDVGTVKSAIGMKHGYDINIGDCDDTTAVVTGMYVTINAGVNWEFNYFIEIYDGTE